MLPFLKPKRITSIIIENRKKSGDRGEVSEADEIPDDLNKAAEALISAVHAKDAKAVAEALHEAFECMEKEPHEEGEHIDE